MIDFLRDEKFFPPLIIGQVTVALTDSFSTSSTVELKSLFSDLNNLMKLRVKVYAFSIFESFSDINIIQFSNH